MSFVAALLVFSELNPAFAAPAMPGARQADAPRCHTPERLQRRWEQHPSGPPAGNATYTRPDEAGYVDSATYPIRIHYRKSGDADRAQNVILPMAEDVWYTEIEVMGWHTPPADYGVGGNDSYDIYLTDDQTLGGAYTFTTYDTGVEPDTNPDDDLYSNSSWIAVDDDQGWISDELMPLFIAHEFIHACQYTIDANEYTLFAWESTAEAVAELYSGNGRQFKDEIHDFQIHPELSVLFDAYTRQVSTYGNDTAYFEYGGWIFGAFIEQAVGTNDGTTLVQMWEDLATGTRSDEPDFVDALGSVGGADFADAGDLFLEFSEWRLMVNDHDDGAHYSDGGDWPSSAQAGTEGTLTLSTVDGTQVTPVNAPYYLGDSVWEIEVDAASTDSLRFDVAGDSTTQWGVVAVGLTDAGPAVIAKARGSDGAGVVTDLPLTGVSKILVAVANLGPSTLDPEEDSIKGKNEFTLSMSLIGETDTAEDTGGGSEKGGCGCATSGQGGHPAALGGLLIAGMLWARGRGERRTTAVSQGR